MTDTFCDELPDTIPNPDHEYTTLAGVTVGVITTVVFVQVNVELLAANDIEGALLSKKTVTTFEEILLEHPLSVFVTTKLYEPGLLKTGEAVVSVPGTIPIVGVQL